MRPNAKAEANRDGDRVDGAGIARRRRLLILTLSVLGVGHWALTSCTKRETPAQLTLAVGPSSSMFEQCGRALAEILNSSRASVSTTTGPVESLQALGRGRAQLAVVPADTLAQAVNGEGPFEASTVSARTMATIYASRLHLVVLEGSSIRGFSQLRNHTVGVGLPATGVDLTPVRALNAALLEDRTVERPVATAEGLDLLAAGRLDALFALDGVPSPAVERLVRQRGTRLRLLNNASVVTLLQRRYGANLYETAQIAPGTYGTAERTDAVGVPTVLVALQDLPEPVAYMVVATLFDRLSRFVAGCPAASGLDVGLASRSTPAALHAGAARFYRRAAAR